MKEISITTGREGFYDITDSVKQAVKESGVREGICVIFVPHTTAGVTINENADPDVISDMLIGLNTAYPDNKNYRHMEGNSTAHIKSSVIGCSEYLIVDKGNLVLGTWQGIYFAEFDGPRNRKYYIKVI